MRTKIILILVFTASLSYGQPFGAYLGLNESRWPNTVLDELFNHTVIYDAKAQAGLEIQIPINDLNIIFARSSIFRHFGNYSYNTDYWIGSSLSVLKLRFKEPFVLYRNHLAYQFYELGFGIEKVYDFYQLVNQSNLPVAAAAYGITNLAGTLGIRSSLYLFVPRKFTSSRNDISYHTSVPTLTVDLLVYPWINFKHKTKTKKRKNDSERLFCPVYN